MLPGAKTPTGELYVTSAAPSGAASASGGVSVEPNGTINIDSGAPALFANGLGVTQAGALAVAVGGGISKYQQGLPFDSAGRLVCQFNAAESVGDSYVGGVWVGGAGGVCVVDASPPVPHAFDSGFDSGFGV